MDPITSSPAAGTRIVRHVGDRIECTIHASPSASPEHGWRARLRTNLGRGAARRAEIIAAATSRIAPFGACWHDIPLAWDGARWSTTLVLAEVGFFTGKPYLIDPEGFQHWPGGADFGVSVHPAWTRSANTVYCAFTRLMGATRHLAQVHPEPDHPTTELLRSTGTAVLPPSGTLRDLRRQLPHVIDRLGCRIIQLLPINPTPTVFARFGPMGSPYAALDLTAIDPALVEFDQRTTGVEQFCELAREIHAREARLFLDIVINHTGWGSRLFEEHPEFFRREPDGRFACPGAWGVVWEDLVELDQDHVPLWNLIAEALLTWCRRGVDGFRCDAGYKIPVHVWQYITARVHEAFPDVVFLLEGLGGSWEATEQLLTVGGMQWAYSELFQNETPADVQSYLDYALEQSRRVGTYIHFSETHDNQRLALRGRKWSRLRNRLCALTSVGGGFGFTSGVEWLAAEKIRVHERTGLAWDQPDNLVDELAQLNRVLAQHPAFYQGAELTRLSPPASTVFALLRVSADRHARALVVVNTSLERSASITLPRSALGPREDWRHDLLDASLPELKWTAETCEVHLAPAEARCVATCGLAEAGDTFRRRSERRAWLIQAATALLPAETLREESESQAARLADAIATHPARMLSALSELARQLRSGSRPCLDLAELASRAAEGSAFPNVIHWTCSETTRVVAVPPGWWLLIEHPAPFRAVLDFGQAKPCLHLESIRGHAMWFACVPPRDEPAALRASLKLEPSGPSAAEPLPSPLLFLGTAPASETSADPRGVVLLTNGRGGMARLRADFGTVASKYDAALAANLHPTLPVDRHVLVKRVRAWLNADGFISALDRHNLAALTSASPARWTFIVNAGDGRTASIEVLAAMLPGRNTTALSFSRAPEDTPLDARLVLRVDLEDRSFHAETQRNPGSEHHFHRHLHPAPHGVGFAFTPAADRAVSVLASRGRYHPQPEWSERVGHPVEASRGQIGFGDAYSPGWFEISLAPGESVLLVLDGEPTPLPPDAPEVRSALQAKSADSADQSVRHPTWDDVESQLSAACQQFIVRRDTGATVIAGYPWFLDWGRDTFIAARGLLAGGWHTEVLGILDVFARFADQGTLPNSIHGANASNRDTSDAPLWFGVLVEEAAACLGRSILSLSPKGSSATLLETVRDLALGYLRGTPNGIRVDPVTALVWSPSHFTWMDTNYPAGTPRQGFPVEIQALWIRVLDFLAREGVDGAAWETLAQRARASVQQLFWIESLGWFADVLHAPAGDSAASALPDQALRPNALFLVSLGVITGPHARRLVEASIRYLLVPGALRSLAPLPVSPPLPIHAPDGRLLNDPHHPYWGRYEGDEDSRRKPAYHNGTAWCWLLPSLCEAMIVAWPDELSARTSALAILGSLGTLLNTGCLGHLPEVLDGDAPHESRGCDAQAWSATEALRLLRKLRDGHAPDPKSTR
ncbi:MAG: glycogen debranching enzyme N-terminal domain-containing protein [Verrucomicrobiales bacterium]|nr:glycogen debranching enzyme N-terminal domain-containing protein [Verrucomicrobiales bacterium]